MSQRDISVTIEKILVSIPETFWFLLGINLGSKEASQSLGDSIPTSPIVVILSGFDQ